MATTAASSEEKSTHDQEGAPEVNLPGLRELREAVANMARRRIPSRATLRSDGLAGLTVGIASVPDGMAGAVLAGVNPICGLYANIAGPIVGGIFASSTLMVVNNTSAVSLVAGQSLVDMPQVRREGALFMMVVLAGAFAIVLGALRLGRLTRFVSFSVMTGFLAGIAVVLILSQLPTVAGEEAQGPNRIAQTLDLLSDPGDFNPASIAVGVVTLVLAAVLRRTRARGFAGLAAIVVPSVIVAVVGLESVQIVRDVGEIPRGLPLPALPSFAETLVVLPGAMAVAVVVLVQGAGVSQSVPNPDGSRSRLSRDFIAQGAANVAAGFFRGLPVGGSLSATALNVVSGATRRWAAIFAGVWVAVIVVALPGAVSMVAMPALGALLILAGVSSIRVSDIAAVWSAGWPSRLAGLTTFALTLVSPIQVAVGVGVVLSALLYMNESSTDVTLVELVKRPDGRVEERQAPTKLPADAVTVLDVYGHLFYAGARTLEHLLPEPHGAQHPAVILRLRGRTHLGATMIEVLSAYANKLRRVDGRLYLSGISEPTYKQLSRSNRLRLAGPVQAHEATPVIGESTARAHEDASAWLVQELEDGTDANS